MFQDELKTKSQNVSENVLERFISVDSHEQDIIVFNIPVIIAIENQINAQGLKNSNSIIEYLSFNCKFSTMKEVVDGVLYHAIRITLRIITDIISKK